MDDSPGAEPHGEMNTRTANERKPTHAPANPHAGRDPFHRVPLLFPFKKSRTTWKSSLPTGDLDKGRGEATERARPRAQQRSTNVMAGKCKCAQQYQVAATGNGSAPTASRLVPPPDSPFYDHE